MRAALQVEPGQRGIRNAERETDNECMPLAAKPRELHRHQSSTVELGGRLVKVHDDRSLDGCQKATHQLQTLQGTWHGQGLRVWRLDHR